MKPDVQKAFLIRIAYLATVLLLTLLGAWLLFTWLFPFTAGLVIAVLLRPLIRKFSKAALLPRRHAAFIVTTAMYLLILITFWIFAVNAAGFLSKTVNSAAESMPALAERLNPTITSLCRSTLIAFERLSPGFSQIGAELTASIGEQLSELSAAAIAWAGRLAASVPALLFTLTLTVLASYFIAMDYPRITGFVLAQIPEKWQDILFGCRRFITVQLFRVLKGYLIIMAITFAELSVGLWLLKIDAPFKKAALTALLDILPLIGTGGILIPWAILEFLQGRQFLAAGLGILYAIITVVRTIAEPKIIGDQTGLSPLVTLSAMFVGWKTAGFAGILAAPLIVMLLCWLQENRIVRLWKDPADK